MSEKSKAYKLYNPVTKKIIISRDVKFSETDKWLWNKNEGTEKGKEVTDTDELEESTTVEENPIDQSANNEEPGPSNTATCTGADQTSSSISASSSQMEPNNEQMNGECGKRVRKPPIWHEDYNMSNMMTGDADNVDELSFAVMSLNDPISFNEAVQNPIWKTAMDEEMKAIERNNTWKLVELPQNTTPIGVKWVYKTKLNEEGKVEKHKARLVAKGYAQRYGINYSEVFAPVARWDTIRNVLALAALNGWKVYQLDVKSAFLHGELVEDVYVNQPSGYVIKGKEDKVYKLLKALYGLKQAPRTWYSRIERYFINEGFSKCPYEHTLFTKAGTNEELLIVSLYEDDLIYTGTCELMINEFKESMKKEFEMSDLKRMKFFLGVEVSQLENGIFITQQKYAKEVLERFGMIESKVVSNPMVPGQKLVKDENGKGVEVTEYKQIIGCLMYLTATRPDLMYAVCLASGFMEKPTTLHMIAVKRILRYIKGTLGLGMFYKRKGTGELVGYTDSDYAGDNDDRRSTSGYVFMINSSAVSWSSKKQPVVTLSTTEAEFIAAASSACQSIWLRRIVERLGSSQRGATVIFCDNRSTIKLSKKSCASWKKQTY